MSVCVLLFFSETALAIDLEFVIVVQFDCPHLSSKLYDCSYNDKDFIVFLYQMYFCTSNKLLIPLKRLLVKGILLKRRLPHVSRVRRHLVSR